MGFQTIPNTDISYGLISYNADGNEIPEAKELMSKRLVERIKTDSISNVFFFCHGWKGDQETATQQYDQWIRAFAESQDRQSASEVFPNFKPLYIGLHWPSLPFGDEEVRGDSFAAAGAPDPESLLKRYLGRLGSQNEIREPLKIIINEARRNAHPDELPAHIEKAYRDLNDALGLRSEGVDAPPDADREDFDPQESYEAGNEEGSPFGGGINMGGILGPLLQLSYWTMKKRARTIGEGGMNTFLKGMQSATSGSNMRIHLMGHSFGTIVVSGMLGGPNAQGALSRPVDSLALVQGAVSLWCYAPAIPFREVLRKAGPGYFTRILADKKVAGPIVTTRSRHDDAVGVFYPLASRIKGSPSFAGAFPKYGAIGAFGIQGLADDVRTDLDMVSAAEPYPFQPEKVYNLNGSQYICHKQGASGAHSDIAGPEVAHAIWSAAFTSARS
jgi:hypothetical protein